jgi:hypothetical protein
MRADTRADQDQNETRRTVTNSSYPPSLPGNISNPFLPGLWPLLGITALALLGFLGAAGLVLVGVMPAGALIPAGLPAALFGMVTVIIFLWGQHQVGQIRNFLESDRPQVRWTYTQAEWTAMREARWQEAREQLFLPLGCLAFLFGIAGLLVGGALAVDQVSSSNLDLEEWLTIALGGVAGALAGGLAGGLMGGVVTLGNWLAALQSYRQIEPGAVALNEQEIYALGRYVKIDGGSTRLVQVEWERGFPTKLLLTISTAQPRRRREELWDIVVPERVLAQVEPMFPQSPPPEENLDEGETDE